MLTSGIAARGATVLALLGTGPLYWIWRIVRVPPDLAYAFWLLGVSSLNFLTAFLLLRKIFDRSPAASGFGAFLFSFASMRLAHVGHPQLLAGFYLILVVYGAIRAFREQRMSDVEYLMAAGVQALVDLYAELRDAGRTLAVANAAPIVVRVLEICGVAERWLVT